LGLNTKRNRQSSTRAHNLHREEVIQLGGFENFAIHDATDVHISNELVAVVGFSSNEWDGSACRRDPDPRSRIGNVVQAGPGYCLSKLTEDFGGPFQPSMPLFQVTAIKLFVKRCPFDVRGSDYGNQSKSDPLTKTYSTIH
jgi:hypothetical protein